MSVRFTATALRQLDDILTYIRERDPQGARRMQERIRAVVDLLDHFPRSGAETSRAGQRRLLASPYPYAIYYRMRLGDVLIQRVRHTARRPIS